MADFNEKDKNEEDLKWLFIFIIVGAFMALGVAISLACISSTGCSQSAGTNASSSQKYWNDSSSHAPKLFRRDATLNDVTINSEMDLSSLGIKYCIIPQKDIEGLQITVKLYDDDKNYLSSITKTLGNVKEGIQVSFSISIFETGFSASYTSASVSGGSVSYFS